MTQSSIQRVGPHLPELSAETYRRKVAMDPAIKQWVARQDPKVAQAASGYATLGAALVQLGNPWKSLAAVVLEHRGKLLGLSGLTTAAVGAVGVLGLAASPLLLAGGGAVVLGGAVALGETRRRNIIRQHTDAPAHTLAQYYADPANHAALRTYFTQELPTQLRVALTPAESALQVLVSQLGAAQTALKSVVADSPETKDYCTTLQCTIDKAAENIEKLQRDVITPAKAKIAEIESFGDKVDVIVGQHETLDKLEVAVRATQQLTHAQAGANAAAKIASDRIATLLGNAGTLAHQVIELARGEPSSPLKQLNA